MSDLHDPLLGWYDEHARDLAAWQPADEVALCDGLNTAGRVRRGTRFPCARDRRGGGAGFGGFGIVAARARLQGSFA